jgi:hypothetical protein
MKSRHKLCLVTLLAFGSGSATAADCVIEPSPPSPPPGCISMEPDCICDVQGQACHWIFHCIRPK